MTDRSVCLFYVRIGACRHGEKCVKRHIKPILSDTIILSNLYQNPNLNKNDKDSNPRQTQEYFENFYKDIFLKFSQLDEIVDLVVCENENNHLNGNVYVKFKSELGAQKAVIELNQQWFGGRPVHCELSPVSSFADATCRAHETDTCDREHCNFMHIKRPSQDLKKLLFLAQEKSLLQKKVEEIRASMETKKETPKEEPEAAQPNGDFKSTFESLFKGS